MPNNLIRFRQLYENNTIPVARTDIAGEYIEVNQAYENLVGYSLDELKQLTYSDITPKRFHSFEHSNVVKKVFQDGETSYDKEYIHKSGRAISVKAHIFLIKNDDESEAGMWGTFVLTQKKSP